MHLNGGRCALRLAPSPENGSAGKGTDASRPNAPDDGEEEMSEALPAVGNTYKSREKRSLGKLATVVPPAPVRHGFTRLWWHESRRFTRMRTHYFWERFAEV